jgi:creatinine deaminase
VIGENKTFLGGEKYLKDRGIEVVNLEEKECQDLMDLFISEKPEIW